MGAVRNRAKLTEVARQEATEATAWRLFRRSGFHHHQEDIRAIEADTSALRIFQPSCIPGLCQTSEYARAVLGESALTDEVLTRTVGARLQRQAVLFDQAKSFRFLITESVLRWRLCSPPEMAVQLDRLVTLSRLPNVWLGIVPLSARMAEVPTSSFAVFDSRLVTVEIPHAEITTAEPRDDPAAGLPEVGTFVKDTGPGWFGYVSAYLTNGNALLTPAREGEQEPWEASPYRLKVLRQ